MKTSKFKLFLDSDGVLADFDAKAYEILGGRAISEVPKGYLWAQVERYDREVAPFFESLDFMPGAERLISFAQDHFEHLAILTASGYTPKDGPDQKRRWYAQRTPDMEVIVVAKSPDKAQFAAPHCILVDDRAKSLDPWIAAGGIGILHVTIDQTIEQLRHYTNVRVRT
jgi:hypothetical protein